VCSALKDELLSLPSICHLKRFSQSLTVEAGFSKATVKYLKQRASYLNLRQKLCCLTKSIAPCAACCEFRLRWRWRNFKNCALFHEYRDCASSYSDIVTFSIINLLQLTQRERNKRTRGKSTSSWSRTDWNGLCAPHGNSSRAKFQLSEWLFISARAGVYNLLLCWLCVA